jgi:hypothetical protein
VRTQKRFDTLGRRRRRGEEENNQAVYQIIKNIQETKGQHRNQSLL